MTITAANNKQRHYCVNTGFNEQLDPPNLNHTNQTNICFISRLGPSVKMCVDLQEDKKNKNQSPPINLFKHHQRQRAAG